MQTLSSHETSQISGGYFSFYNVSNSAIEGAGWGGIVGLALLIANPAAASASQIGSCIMYGTAIGTGVETVREIALNIDIAQINYFYPELLD